MRTIQDMVQQEVNCCLSSLVSTLAAGSQTPMNNHELLNLMDQASELAMPVPDYEEAAIQAGYKIETIGAGDWQFTAPDGGVHGGFDSHDESCANAGIEPYDSEVFEHWAISKWLADKLIEQGEKVDTDFGGLNVWARQTTGQGIASDGVIERIYANMMKGV